MKTVFTLSDEPCFTGNFDLLHILYIFFMIIIFGPFNSSSFDFLFKPALVNYKIQRNVMMNLLTTRFIFMLFEIDYRCDFIAIKYPKGSIVFDAIDHKRRM